jgi:hypothetical protein
MSPQSPDPAAVLAQRTRLAAAGAAVLAAAGGLLGLEFPPEQRETIPVAGQPGFFALIGLAAAILAVSAAALLAAFASRMSGAEEDGDADQP